MNKPVFTIGHSTRTITEFVDLLRPEEVKLVVDIRTMPRSRTNPRFNRDVFPEALSKSFRSVTSTFRNSAVFAGSRRRRPHREILFGPIQASAITLITH
jgi:uncharacterized protein (DUF488 family)